MASESYVTRLISWIVENSSLDERSATAFVRKEMEDNGDGCWLWQAVYIISDNLAVSDNDNLAVSDNLATCHVYDASDWRERGYKVYEV